MKRGRLPLTALRTFEVAGRRESFTEAANELFISQAAVSRQVRELEALLGRPLFERLHRRVRLSEAGRSLLSVLTGAFDAIDQSLEDLKDAPARPRVTVSAEPSFAACWLVPNLMRFQALHPGVDVVLDADPRPIGFRGSEPVLAIRHSTGQSSWPRVEARRLVDVHLTPVLHPDLQRTGGAIVRPQDLMRHPLLHEENRDLWARWFAATGTGKPPGAQDGHVYTDGALVLQAALRAQGVALADTLFVADDVAAGRLMRPFATAVPHGAYFLVARRFDRLPDAAAAFAAWLEQAFRAVTAASGPP
ncbi:LysR substrate-binding domain-containing protein [Rhizobium sp. TRM95111]|uniref:LysR substrate-binding domain-containing protein n=1 Tax=Rhizobium alarense TaxID=2846851 RepID=UPI001F30B567|nr:LysR substrate-binding domain-containing protein [Rhizobium alarense]MCF3641838.1 LysR substrate-binding domain-containing protein [Rhizobium alarense]